MFFCKVPAISSAKPCNFSFPVGVQPAFGRDRMKPRQLPAQEPDGLFKTPLDRFIDMSHPLVQLADRIDWTGLDALVERRFGTRGRPGVPSRFMLGMMMLKSIENLSDENLFARWSRDPYFQYFTGERYFQHHVPHDRSGISIWRRRLGPEFLDHLLQESLRVAHRSEALRESDMEAVTVDTTVQEKAIRFPTDASLAYTALVRLAILARKSGLKQRQSYIRVGKRALIQVGRYGHAGQYKRRDKEILFLKRRLGRVIRDIERRIAGDVELEALFADPLARARIIRDQILNRKASPKIYSWHAPEVECIGKGKARTRHEFGCKSTVTATNARAPGGMFVLHADALHGNPYDGHTLGTVLDATADLTGVTPRRAFVDKGYRGHKQDRLRVDPETRETRRPPWKVFMAGRKGLEPHLKAELKRRPGIEPVIGHLKGDHGMERNHLKGRAGDRFNVKMAAVGFNLRRVLAWLEDRSRDIRAAFRDDPILRHRPHMA